MVGFVVAFLLLLTRGFHLLDRPDFYIEDGREFFQNAHNLGFSSLLRVYPGYLHLFPRIASRIADAFPLKDGQIAPYAALAPGQQLNVKTSIDRRSNASWRMTLVKK